MEGLTAARSSAALRRRWIVAALASALLMTGLARTDAASASLLLNLEVVFTAVLAWLVFGEPAGTRTFRTFIIAMDTVDGLTR